MNAWRALKLSPSAWADLCGCTVNGGRELLGCPRGWSHQGWGSRAVNDVKNNPEIHEKWRERGEQKKKKLILGGELIMSHFLSPCGLFFFVAIKSKIFREVYVSPGNRGWASRREWKRVAVNGTTTGRPQGLSLNIKSRLAILNVRCTGEFCLSFLCLSDKNSHVFVRD